MQISMKINLIPQISHYSLVHAPNRKYLDAKVTIRYMCNELKNSVGPVNYFTYYNVFKSMNISLGLPQNDLCDLCESHKFYLKSHDLIRLGFGGNCEECDKYLQHI